MATSLLALTPTTAEQVDGGGGVMTNRKRWMLWGGVVLALMLGGLAVSCGGDDEITQADFEGSWTALEYTITPKDDPAAALELIGAGASFLFDADDEGNFSGEMGIPEPLGGPMTIPSQGTFEVVDQETVRLTFDPAVPPFLTSFTGPFELDGDTLTLTDEGSTFDFGAGEVPVTAIVNLER